MAPIPETRHTHRQRDPKNPRTHSTQLSQTASSITTSAHCPYRCPYRCPDCPYYPERTESWECILEPCPHITAELRGAPKQRPHVILTNRYALPLGVGGQFFHKQWEPLRLSGHTTRHTHNE